MELIDDTDKKDLICVKCNKTFKDKWNLERHMNRKKKCVTKTSYICSICNKNFTRKDNLDRHLAKKNGCGFVSVNLENKIEIIMKKQNEELSKILNLKLFDTSNMQNINMQKINNTNLQNIDIDIDNSNTQNIENATMNNMSSACLINYVVNQYPNAKNIEDCIKFENIPKSILIDCEDMYFTEGSMKIFKTLCDLGEAYRPIHCTDASRGNFIYKTNDVWKIDVGGEAIKSHFFPVIQEAYIHVHKQRIKNNPGNSTIISNYLTEMTSVNIKKVCQKTLKRLSNDFLAKNSKNSKLIKNQIR